MVSVFSSIAMSVTWSGTSWFALRALRDEGAEDASETSSSVAIGGRYVRAREPSGRFTPIFRTVVSPLFPPSSFSLFPSSPLDLFSSSFLSLLHHNHNRKLMNFLPFLSLSPITSFPFLYSHSDFLKGYNFPTSHTNTMGGHSECDTPAWQHTKPHREPSAGCGDRCEEGFYALRGTEIRDGGWG